MLFAYLTLDEVNEDLARRLAAPRGIELDVLSFRDAAPDGQFDAVLYDLDSLPSDRRQEILARLGNGATPEPVAVHSNNLETSQVRELRSLGVLVTRTLHSQVFVRLCRSVRARTAARTNPEGSVA